MLSILTHATSEKGFELLLENSGIKTSQYFKTISTSQDGSFNNNSYRPFILEIDTSIIDIFEGKPCFYIPGYSEVYLDKYALFNPRFLWEWEIFFTKNIPLDYIYGIYAVSINNEYTSEIELLLDKYEKEYGIAEIYRYDYSERIDYWNDALGYKNSDIVSYILKKENIEYEELKDNKKTLDIVWDYINEVNIETAENTNTMDIYENILKNKNNFWETKI